MPIFDFTCNRCDNEFESLILGEKIHAQCPECGSFSVNRQSVYLFNCTGVKLTKRLKMDSEELMNKGSQWMKKQPLRKDRIKIL